MDTKILPNHIAIIPDGNRRWAREHGLPSIAGHKKGLDTAEIIANKVRASGVHTLTFWAFSTENWSRSGREVRYLMRLYSTFIDRNIKNIEKERTHYVHIGRKDRLSDALLKRISLLEEKTKRFKKNYLNFAIDYGGRDEILRGIQKLINSGVKSDQIDEETFSKTLDTSNEPYPNPDLIIRTSGEQRTSGLMPWQAAYAEYIFIDKFFPDLTPKDIDWALAEYARRQRRFGK